MKNLFLILCISFFFSACSKVNVVLLPEENNKVGKIEITNKGNVLTVDKAYQQVEAIDGKSEILKKEDVIKKFSESINTLPSKPVSYLLYFKWDSKRLVPKSYKVLKNIIKESKKESTLYIDIIGHTDRAGKDAYNKKLSLKRANSISKQLVKKGIKKEKISIEFYGESAPVIKTRDGVAKKINRRVEVIIK